MVSGIDIHMYLEVGTMYGIWYRYSCIWRLVRCVASGIDIHMYLEVITMYGISNRYSYYL